MKFFFENKSDLRDNQALRESQQYIIAIMTCSNCFVTWKGSEFLPKQPLLTEIMPYLHLRALEIPNHVMEHYIFGAM